ncbi:MAG TPA: CHASE3 domain-containing protein [Candidatus Acidoferrales bacterium]|nr:CHASE3 domain-containing protein [Candidatus Acidoferrales bacterium]
MASLHQAFDRGLIIGAGLLVALLIIDAGLSYKNTRQLHQDAQLVTHTTDVIEALEEIGSTVKDAETGQRGYVITGEKSYLEPYHDALKKIHVKTTDAKSLTVDNLWQQAQLPKLDRLIAAKLDDLEQVVALRNKSPEAARQAILNGRGKKLMDDIRNQLSGMEQEEEHLLRTRAAQAEHEYQVAITTGVVATLLALVIFGGFIYLLRQNLMQRAKSAASLEEQREWFRTTLASIGDAVIATDTKGRVTFLNAIAENLTGWTSEEGAGVPLEEVFRIVNEQTRETVQNPASRALREGVTVGLANHTVLLNKLGIEFPIDDSASPIRSADGNIVGVVLVFRDVTTRRQAENSLRDRTEQLAEANRLKNEFLAMLAHELRNPLAPIQNALHLIQAQGFDKDEDRRELWAIVQRQVESLVRLVDDLLDVSRITRGKITVHKQPVEVSTIVSRAVESGRPLIDSRLQKLEISLPHERLLVEADLTRITQVIANLLNNAAKYTPEGGHIWVRAERDGDQAVFRVRDDGVGISAEMLPKIFDLFSQSEQTLDRAQGGLGIGLTLARRLTEMHKGTVTAFSEGLGKGSEFVVRLPLLTETATVTPSSSKAPSDGMSRVSTAMHVLVVDDNRDAANTLALLLRRWGQDVQVAYDGNEALAQAEAHPPDLILLDIGLPGRDGYEVARLIRSHPELANATIVALTGYGTEEDRQQSRAVGFDQHLVKPVAPDKLRGLLDSLSGVDSHA